jgi:hypothetical protein
MLFALEVADAGTRSLAAGYLGLTPEEFEVTALCGPSGASVQQRCKSQWDYCPSNPLISLRTTRRLLTDSTPGTLFATLFASSIWSASGTLPVNETAPLFARIFSFDRAPDELVVQVGASVTGWS